MRYAVLLLLTTFVACSTEYKDKQHTRSNRARIVNLDAVANESFKAFYKRFSSDSLYQVSHIFFPVRVEVYDMNDTATVTWINGPDWGFMNFDLRKPYKVIVTSEKDTVKVNFQKEDTGIYTDYLFTRVNRKWMMVKIVDLST